MDQGKYYFTNSDSPSVKTNPFVSVVFSFFNEETVIPELLRRTRDVLRSRDDLSGYELVFVNDSSTDRSEELLREEIDLNGDIVLTNLSRNFGASESVYAGFQASSGDAVIYMDSDLQDPPEVINELLDAYLAEPDVEVVYTTRRKRSGENRIKMLFTKIGYRLVRSLSNIDIPNDSGDFKLLSRKVVNLLLFHEERLPYMRGLISYYGFKQKQVIYDRDPRYDGREQSKLPLFSRRVLYYHFDRALIAFSDAPLKASLFLGFTLAILAGIYLVIVLIQKILGLHEPGWPAIMATMLLLGGTQLLLFGLLGLYVNTIYLEVKRRPNYVVQELIRGRLTGEDARSSTTKESPKE